MTKVVIYRLSKNAMQSGRAATDHWVIRFEETRRKFIEPVMGWTGSEDTTQQLNLTFSSQEKAVAYAKSKGFDYSVSTPQERQVKPRPYADNFACHKTQYSDPQ